MPEGPKGDRGHRRRWRKVGAQEEERIAIGGLRRTALSLGKVPGLAEAGLTVRAALLAFFSSHPHAADAFTGSLGKEDAVIGERLVLGARRA